jgi:hypothetical protein
MSERPLYVYQLRVDIPAECRKPGFEPDAWVAEYGDTNSVFSWPPRRNYFSYESARKRALLLSRWGARVMIERRPVERGDDIGFYVDGDCAMPDITRLSVARPKEDT